MRRTNPTDVGAHSSAELEEFLQHLSRRSLRTAVHYRDTSTAQLPGFRAGISELVTGFTVVRLNDQLYVGI